MSEELPQIELSEEEVLEQVDEMNCKKSLGLVGVHPEFLRRLNYKTAEVSTAMCNPCLPSFICQERGGKYDTLFKKNWETTVLSAFYTKEIVRKCDEK